MLSLINEQWAKYTLYSPALPYFLSLTLDCYNCFAAPCVHITNVYVVIEI